MEQSTEPWMNGSGVLNLRKERPAAQGQRIISAAGIGSWTSETIEK